MEKLYRSMVLDFIGLTIIIIFFIRGYMKGIIVAVFSVLAIILGIVCALKLSGIFGAWLLEKGWVTTGWATIISYAILFFGVLVLVRLLAKAIQSVAQLTMLGWLNGLIGGLLYAFMAAVIWSSILWIANQVHFVSPETKTYSKTYSYLEPLAPWVFEYVGKLLPFAKDVFSDLSELFNDANQNLPEHVGTDR
ncbi:MAG TPA: CvpA family protein [Flavipsychrobacter sp.]|nr:CvpA family protein [Flavipsychrobacter sp.]